ncbi:hypothetical protein OESDEN_24555, partial [Oesophagostomum dentatum]
MVALPVASPSGNELLLFFFEAIYWFVPSIG